MTRAIFVTASLNHGGAERLSIAVMNRLAERGHECHAVYIKQGRDQLDRIRLRGGGTVRCLDAARYLDRRALADFAAHVSRVRPAAIVAANAYALMYAWFALGIARLRLPLIVTYHSTRLLGAKEELQMLAYRLFFWTSDCLVFVCENQRRHWLRRGVFSRRNEVIHNGVDTEAFRDRWSPEERRALRAALGVAERDYVIGVPALLRPEKNHVQLVEAIALLRRRGIPARALLIGDGGMREAIEVRARQLDVAGDILITGLKEDVRPYLAACDTVALCSLTEALPMAAVEAMALRRPVVLSDVGGAAELVVPGRNGYLFPVGDTEAFAARLAALADPALSASMGSEARAAVETRFSEKAMVDRYERLLLDLCRSPAFAGP